MTTPSAPATALPFWMRSTFAPVSEEITAHELPVIGELPRELSGTYLRNGPNPRSGVSRHWWFGEGMLHGVRLAEGRARWYRNRYVGGAAPPNEAGEDERARRLRRGGANTHVIEHGGRLLALVESALPVEIDEELATRGVFDFGGALDTPMTAHPKRCPLTGELHFFGYQAVAPHLTYYVADPGGRVTSRRELDVGGPSLMHDFAITEHHVVFFDGSARMVSDWGRGFPFAWSDAHQARIGVAPRAGGDLRWFEVASAYLGHTVNAFERDGRIILDGVRYAGLEGAAPLLHRWELDLATGRAHELPLDGRPVEFPRIDERRTGLPHRYAYLVEPRDVVDDVPMSALLRRYDVTTGTSLAHDFGRRQVPAECVFVPARPDAPEDAGWLLTYVHDRERDTSDLVVLDASAFDAPPVARVRLPRRVPFGFHGSWIPCASPS